MDDRPGRGGSGFHQKFHSFLRLAERGGGALRRQKIQLAETAEADPYVSLVKRLAVDDKLDFDTAKLLITEYRKTKEEV